MRAVLWLVSLSLVPSMALETFQFYQARLCQEDTQMCYAMKILVHQTCAKSDTLSVYLIHLYLNVTLPQVFFKHFASKNQLPGFYISGTLVENELTEDFCLTYSTTDRYPFPTNSEGVLFYTFGSNNNKKRSHCNLNLAVHSLRYNLTTPSQPSATKSFTFKKIFTSLCNAS